MCPLPPTSGGEESNVEQYMERTDKHREVAKKKKEERERKNENENENEKENEKEREYKSNSKREIFPRQRAGFRTVRGWGGGGPERGKGREREKEGRRTCSAYTTAAQ